MYFESGNAATVLQLWRSSISGSLAKVEVLQIEGPDRKESLTVDFLKQ